MGVDGEGGKRELSRFTGGQREKVPSPFSPFKEGTKAVKKGEGEEGCCSYAARRGVYLLTIRGKNESDHHRGQAERTKLAGR